MSTLVQSSDSFGEPRAAAPFPGVGTRLRANALGYSISARGGGFSFGHPWKPSLNGRGLRLSRGVVIDLQGGKGFEPLIDGMRMGGEPGRAQPFLKLDPKVANAAGESWACVEVEPDAEGVLTAPEKVRIVHASHPKFTDNTALERHALVLIVWQGGQPRIAEAIAHFHLKFLRWQPPTGAGKIQYFFV